MNTKGKTPINESTTKLFKSTLMRWAGVSAMVAGLCFIVIGMFHPVNVPAAVTTAVWVNVNILAFALGFFGLFGMAGLYARQAKQSGWLGLAGFVLLSVWITLQSGFSFVEAFILPRLATDSPAFVAGYLGMSTGIPSEIDLGILPTLWTISNPMYLLGPLLFGIATFRAGILPRWAGALLAIGALLVPFAAVLPPVHEAKVTIPGGVALVWLGYSLWAEKRQRAVEPVPGRASSGSIQPEASQVV